MSERETDEYDKLILSLIDQRINYRQNWLSSFRDRASNLIQINLLFMGIIVTISTFIIGAKITFSSLLVIAVLSSIVFALISIIFSLGVLAPVPNDMVDLSKFDEIYRDENIQDQLGAYIQTSLDAIRDNSKSRMPTVFNISMLFFVLSVADIVIIAFQLILLNAQFV